ncbi:hypothetical protein DY218_13305 [Streptomyces triticagri]|uniref:Uncharacterized protein n=1 Tax=Streptomyces triticagri TaxID=2293568 RepID=A0A372M727_9ACTN|nr:hypothetical protein [Streptomyces triticagri]RFU86107.1 hypothetical protein DY218_13305 [Streptomyces triticagri]
MGQKIVRTALVAGVVVLALLLLLATCGGGKDDDKKDDKAKKPDKKSQGPATKLDVPAAYDTSKGWEITGLTSEYALAGSLGRIAFLERADETRFRIRTVDAATGKPRWRSDAWRPLSDKPGEFPHLLSLTKDDREYFVTWSYGKLAEDPLTEADRLISLDVYDARDGSRQRIELPWPVSPSVSGAGPGILIGKGTTRAAVVDPVTGRVSNVESKDLKYPKGCKNCKRLTEVVGYTEHGVLVSGAGEFWVRGGWHARKTAPKGTDAGSGTVTTTVGDYVLAKWDKKRGTKGAGKQDVWAVHDAENGKTVATVECRKPAIVPGRYPDATMSAGGRYLVAGNLAFDLEDKSGQCFEEEDGAKPLALTTVTDEGLAYGATGARSPQDALKGGGSPVEVRLSTGEPQALSASLRLPAFDLAGIGLFQYTDGKDVPHLLGYRRAR